MQRAYLRIINAETSIVTEQTLADIQCWCFSGVTSVLLEGKAKDGNLLARDCVEHGINNSFHKALLLIVIDQHNLHQRYWHLKPCLAVRME